MHIEQIECSVGKFVVDVDSYPKKQNALFKQNYI